MQNGLDARHHQVHGSGESDWGDHAHIQACAAFGGSCIAIDTRFPGKNG
jgi:hypothetical protein